MRWKRRKVVLGTGDYLNVCIMVAGTHSEACDESRGTKKFTDGNKICSRSAFDRENLSFFFFFLSFFSFSELRREAGFFLFVLFFFSFRLVGGMKFEDVYWIGLPRGPVVSLAARGIISLEHDVLNN